MKKNRIAKKQTYFYLNSQYNHPSYLYLTPSDFIIHFQYEASISLRKAPSLLS